eukprot:SAG31_NODE_55_length_29938_cov_9.154027_19_plen_42_part_00
MFLYFTFLVSLLGGRAFDGVHLQGLNWRSLQMNVRQESGRS